MQWTFLHFVKGENMVVISNLGNSNEGRSSLLFISGADEYTGVDKIADKVRLDVERVTGAKPERYKAADDKVTGDKGACDKAVLGTFDVSGLSAVLARSKSDDAETCSACVPEFDKLGTDEASVLIYGTIGKSELVTVLEKSGVIDLSKVRGKREVYSFTIAEKGSVPGIDKPALIIVGSDKRGTIYGLFHLSELMGVSPLVDWAGIMPPHKDRIELTKKDNMVSKEPSVKYRGFFINDEWPAFGNWTTHNYGGFNATMYEHVFELLLRLKGNYMWPAMWSARFSVDGPGLANAELADEIGVIMGASHHEPCCRNGEEYKYLRGKDSVYGDAWNFRANREGITRFWEDGLKRSGKFENVITVGMRGEADTAILGRNATLKDNIDLLRDVLKTQNELIRTYVNPDEQKVPRMLALYKEVEPYFYGDEKTPGLKGDPELEGVTLMLCDDNHGHLRTVPTEEMRGHKGGYGMYYHFDYHGSPYSYEWANTNSLPEVKEQMCAAYEFGIRELWIVNVGDIFSNEFPLSYFLDLAYDYEKYSDLQYTTEQYTKEWVDFQFAQLKKQQRKSICDILTCYTRLARMRRTECIWPDTFHPVNFGEGDRVLAEAEDIVKRVERLKKSVFKECSESLFAGFYSQVYFPAAGTMNVLRLQLIAGKNRWYAEHGIIAANPLCKKIREYIAFDKKLVKELDTVDGGRWYGMGWSEHIGFRNWNEEENQLPAEIRITGANKPRLVVWLDGDSTVTSGLDWTRRPLLLKAFRNPEVTEYCLNIAAGSVIPAEFEIVSDKPWLKTSVTKGEVSEKNQLQKVRLMINRDLLAKFAAESLKSEESANSKDSTKTRENGAFGPENCLKSAYVALVKIIGKDRSAGSVLIPVVIDVSPLPAETAEYPVGTYVQTEDYISIEASHFSASEQGAGGSAFKVLPGYGKSLAAIKVFPETAWFTKREGAPSVEYKFAITESVTDAVTDTVTNNLPYEKSDDSSSAEFPMKFSFYQSPLNPVDMTNAIQFLVELNGRCFLRDTVPANFAVGDNKEPWSTDVTNDIRIHTVTLPCHKGLNTLRIYPVSPSFVLEKIVVYPENKELPYSYLGVPETYRLC